MIEQLKTFPGNTLAIEIIESYTKEDEKLFQKFFEEKIAQGFEHVHVLMKLDELKISQINVKAFMEDILWTLRHYKQVGHLAVVAHSNIMKALVPIDNLFFQRASKGRLERYFDISQMEEALKFVTAP